MLQLLVDAHQEVDGALRLAIDLAEVVAQQRRVRLGGEVGRQFLRHQRFVLEREILGAGLEEEIERVVDRHLHHQVDRHLELGGLLRENQPRLVIGEGVLLPVDEMLRRLDLERIGDDGAARMRRGPQTHHLGAQLHRPVVAVVGDVVQCGVDGHAVDTSKAGASFEATRWPARSAGRVHEPLRMRHAQRRQPPARRVDDAGPVGRGARTRIAAATARALGRAGVCGAGCAGTGRAGGCLLARSAGGDRALPGSPGKRGCAGQRSPAGRRAARLCPDRPARLPLLCARAGSGAGGPRRHGHRRRRRHAPAQRDRHALPARSGVGHRGGRARAPGAAALSGLVRRRHGRRPAAASTCSASRPTCAPASAGS